MIQNNKRKDSVHAKDNLSECYFDETTGTVRIIIKRASSETRVCAATPVIMSRKIKRAIRNNK